MREEFQFQRYYFRWVCALPCLILAFAFNDVLSLFLKNSLAYLIVCTLFTLGLLALYYFSTQHWAVFQGNGAYWMEEDTLCIQLGDKTHRITQVTRLTGSKQKVLRNRFVLLVIKTPHETIKLFSLPLENGQRFADTALYPLYVRLRDMERGQSTPQNHPEDPV
jgi:hypothetical protein